MSGRRTDILVIPRPFCPRGRSEPTISGPNLVLGQRPQSGKTRVPVGLSV